MMIRYIIVAFFSFLVSPLKAQDSGALKNVIITYDTTYEINNSHKWDEVRDAYVDRGLILYVYDGPYRISIISEQKGGIDNGLYMTFYIDTNMPESKGNLKNGKEDGIWYYWNKDGDLSEKKIWANGKLIKIRKSK